MFVLFMECLGWTFVKFMVLLVAFRVFEVFMGHWGWTFVAFKVFVLFMECLGWTFVTFTAFAAFMRRSGWSFLWRLECS